mmetsp:Transcript_56791/g.104321  ORF Transcript_56791/g.104321 Transcript_56791/m.104321 type:complete len:333 (-) Transcript_56791:635-1633(-)
MDHALSSNLVSADVSPSSPAQKILLPLIVAMGSPSGVDHSPSRGLPLGGLSLTCSLLAIGASSSATSASLCFSSFASGTCWNPSGIQISPSFQTSRPSVCNSPQWVSSSSSIDQDLPPKFLIIDLSPESDQWIMLPLIVAMGSPAFVHQQPSSSVGTLFSAASTTSAALVCWSLLATGRSPSSLLAPGGSTTASLAPASLPLSLAAGFAVPAASALLASASFASAASVFLAPACSTSAASAAQTAGCSTSAKPASALLAPGCSTSAASAVLASGCATSAASPLPAPGCSTSAASALLARGCSTSAASALPATGCSTSPSSASLCFSFCASLT